MTNEDINRFGMTKHEFVTFGAFLAIVSNPDIKVTSVSEVVAIAEKCADQILKEGDK